MTGYSQWDLDNLQNFLQGRLHSLGICEEGTLTMFVHHRVHSSGKISWIIYRTKSVCAAKVSQSTQTWLHGCKNIWTLVYKRNRNKLQVGILTLPLKPVPMLWTIPQYRPSWFYTVKCRMEQSKIRRVEVFNQLVHQPLVCTLSYDVDSCFCVQFPS